jgi:hypothetical protein
MLFWWTGVIWRDSSVDTPASLNHVIVGREPRRDEQAAN